MLLFRRAGFWVPNSLGSSGVLIVSWEVWVTDLSCLPLSCWPTSESCGWRAVAVTSLVSRGHLPYIDTGDLLPQQPSSQVRGAWAVSDVQSPFSLDRPWAAFAGRPQAQTMCPCACPCNVGPVLLRGPFGIGAGKCRAGALNFNPQWQEMQHGDVLSRWRRLGVDRGLVDLFGVFLPFG